MKKWLLWALPVFFASTAQAQESPVDVRFFGLLDLRAAYTSDTVSWLDEGLGKTRYGARENGSGSRAIARVSDINLIAVPRILEWDLSGVIHVAYEDTQQDEVDLKEAFIRYRPAPTSQWGYEARIGAFFPPISFENDAIAWTNPYTLSNSAINSWVGEELKTIGTEAKVFFQTFDYEVSLRAAAFRFNDPAGSLLAWRGWALHDRETGLWDQLPFAPLDAFRPGQNAELNAQWVNPVREVDSKWGLYGQLEIEHFDWGTFRLMYYDNKADEKDIVNRQYAWNTHFWALGFKTELPGEVEFLTQGMVGNTEMGRPFNPRFARVVDADFWAYYSLLSRQFGPHRLSFRADVFAVGEQDGLPYDDNWERGHAFTGAYVVRPFDKQRLTLEVLHVVSDRRERTFFGDPRRIKETQLQISYRFFL